ncbi:MAG: 50S ribosomal protein L4 [Candidatus Uhrbacteria bacterium]
MALKVSVYNQEGSPVGEVELDASVFGVRVKPTMLHQVVVAAEANARESIAHTKTRGEVRGGGRKPWAQKHTGRARHGSIRSPLWVGGGKTFGPRRERGYAQKVNTKVRRQAIRMALSDKVASGRLVIFDNFLVTGCKTKIAKNIFGKTVGDIIGLPGGRIPSILIALAAEERSVMRSIRNLPRVRGIDAAHFNVRDVLRAGVLVSTRAGIAQAAERFAPKKKLEVGN